jgi:hypothetical protein
LFQAKYQTEAAGIDLNGDKLTPLIAKVHDEAPG